MNTEHLHYLLTINQYHSINQAAEALHLQRSYLSRVVSTLEKQLGITIFERVPKGVLPTPEGAYALERIEAALAILTELEQHFTRSENPGLGYHGQLTLYCPTRLRPRNQMIRIMERYQGCFPNISLILADLSYAEAEKTLAGKADRLAVVLHSETIKSLNWTIPEKLHFIPLAEVPVVALTANDEAVIKKYQSISLATLCKQNLVLMNNGSDDQPPFYGLLAEHGTPHIKHIVSGNFTLFYDLMRTGRYFSIGLVDQRNLDGLRQIPLRDHIVVTTGLLYDPAVLDNVPAKALLDIILEQMDGQQYRTANGGGPS